MVNKHQINKLIKRFGIEVHGSGYMAKLISQQQNKNSFKAQQLLINNEAPVIFDVGANNGFTTKQYLSYFRFAKIHAFEAFDNYRTEWETIQKMHPNIFFNAVALMDKVCEIELNVNQRADTNSVYASTSIGAASDTHCVTKEKIKISATTVDEYCAQLKLSQIDILKLDVQGAELNVLQGSRKMLENKKIKLIYAETYFKEQYINQPLFNEILIYLKSVGYGLQDIYNPFYNSRFLLWCDAIFLPS